jgi:hypothetical protein
MNQSNATEQASVARRRNDPEAHCALLEWFLVAGDAAMGERGTLAGTISVLEHGGQTGGMPSGDLYSDQQIGFGPTIPVGLVERHRWLTSAWNTLGRQTQGTLGLCYQAPRANLRSDEASGFRSGTEAQLGRYAALAFWLTPKPAKLLEACQDPKKGGHGRVIGHALKVARDAAIAAHATWRVALESSGKPRRGPERGAYLPTHEPGADAT